MGKRIGTKPPQQPSQAWSIRAKLQMQGLKRDLALFNYQNGFSLTVDT